MIDQTRILEILVGIVEVIQEVKAAEVKPEVNLEVNLEVNMVVVKLEVKLEVSEVLHWYHRGVDLVLNLNLSQEMKF